MRPTHPEDKREDDDLLVPLAPDLPCAPQPLLQPTPAPLPWNPGPGVRPSLAPPCRLTWRASPTEQEWPGSCQWQARPWGLTMVSSAAAQRRYSTSTAATDATRPTAATGLCTLLGVGPPLRRRQLVVSASGQTEAWNPASDWPLLDSRSMVPSDWIRLWREDYR